MPPVNSITDVLDSKFASVEVTSKLLESDPEEGWFRVDHAAPEWGDIPIEDVVAQQAASVADYVIGKADGRPIVMHVPDGESGSVSSYGEGHPGWCWRADGEVSTLTVWVEIVA